MIDILPSRLPKHRFTAALIHFLISCLIFSAFVSTLLLIWYPAPYFAASGGWQGLRLVAAVDLALGPLLTLILYNTSKSGRELFTDLAIVAMIQISALIWGIIAVYEQRPVAAVFWGGSFYTVPAEALTNQGEDLQQLKSFTGTGKGPVYVYAQPPVSALEHELMLQEMSEKRVPPHEQPQRYRVLEDHFAELQRASVNITEIISNNETMGERLTEILQATSTTIEDNYYVSLVSRYRNIVLVFSRQNQLIGMLNAPLKDGPQ